MSTHAQISRNVDANRTRSGSLRASAPLRENPQDKFFLPYQAKWIKDNSRLKLMEKSRQIGISWSTAYRMAAETGKVGARYDTWASSRDEIQARLLLDDVRNFAAILGTAATDLGEILVDEERRINAHVLQFANSRRVNSMSSNPNAQAGKRGSRVLDEFALHPDPRLLYSIAYPGITWGGNLEIISTHRGTGNFFNSLVEEIKHKGNPKGVSLHTVTLQDALDQGFLAKLKAKLPKDDERQEMDAAAYFDFIRKGCPDDETFQQEYMCRPSDDKAAFLTYDEIASCVYRGEDSWELTDAELAKSECYLGMDVARVGDFTVFWLIERMAGMLFTRRILCERNASFDAQEKILYGLLDLPCIRRCCIDASGLGMQLAERAVQRYGSRVEAVTFTPSVKESLAYPLRAAFVDKNIRVPADKLIETDLRSVKKELTAAGNVRFMADRGPGGHADRFWALALSIHAAGSHVSPFAYERVTPTDASEKWGGI